MSSTRITDPPPFIPGFRIQNSRFGGSIFGTQAAEFKTQNSEFKTQGSKLKVRVWISNRGGVAGAVRLGPVHGRSGPACNRFTPFTTDPLPGAFLFSLCASRSGKARGREAQKAAPKVRQERPSFPPGREGRVCPEKEEPPTLNGPHDNRRTGSSAPNTARFYFSLPYSSSVTGSSHSLEVFSPGTSKARWANHPSAAAPCQCLTLAGIWMTVPGRISTAGLPSS